MELRARLCNVGEAVAIDENEISPSGAENSGHFLRVKFQAKSVGQLRQSCC